MWWIFLFVSLLSLLCLVSVASVASVVCSVSSTQLTSFSGTSDTGTAVPLSASAREIITAHAATLAEFSALRVKRPLTSSLSLSSFFFSLSSSLCYNRQGGGGFTQTSSFIFFPFLLSLSPRKGGGVDFPKSRQCSSFSSFI